MRPRTGDSNPRLEFKQLLTIVGLPLTALALLWVLTPIGAAETSSTQEETATELEPLEYQKWQTTTPGRYADYNQRANLLQRGHLVYQKYCIGCHGEKGDGKGPAAIRLQTQPRDFTSGIYKFRSTDSGSLPMESDLHRTITRGLARVSMPAFPLMPEGEKIAVIEYIKAFYAGWENEKMQRAVVPVPRAPADLETEDRIGRGRVVYVEMQCNQCHGIDGRGTGATRTEYVDAWGNPQKPFDFTRGSLKGGNDPEDIYRTFNTGLRSIMPAYGGDTVASAARQSFNDKRDLLLPGEYEQLEPLLEQFPESAGDVFGSMSETERLELAGRNSWDLVAYILSLRQSTSTAEAVLGSDVLSGR